MWQLYYTCNNSDRHIPYIEELWRSTNVNVWSHWSSVINEISRRRGYTYHYCYIGHVYIGAQSKSKFLHFWVWAMNSSSKHLIEIIISSSKKLSMAVYFYTIIQRSREVRSSLRSCHYRPVAHLHALIDTKLRSFTLKCIFLANPIFNELFYWIYKVNLFGMCSGLRWADRRPATAFFDRRRRSPPYEDFRIISVGVSRLFQTF